MTNKKAQSMSTNTIILLILGLAILVVLILGFMSGWKVFSGIISPTTVDKVSEDCSSACGLRQEFSYCSGLRDFRINEEDFSVKTSCAVLASNADLGRGYVDECGAISCELTCSQIVIEDDNNNKVAGQMGSEVPEGAYDVTNLASDVAPGQYCFVQL
jgi:hypothetical protein